MKMIQANCRVQFTAEDIEFILTVLGPKAGTAETLVNLLTDEGTRDLILDDPSLLHALLECRDCLRVSTHFYFYILVRQNFLKESKVFACNFLRIEKQDVDVAVGIQLAPAITSGCQ